MTPTELLGAWLAELTGMKLVSGERNATANANMEAFSIADAQDTAVEAAALAGFLRDAFRAYSQAAARAGLVGWFYAWHDERAGQLRMSAAAVASASELPFRRELAVVDDPLVIAEAALASDLAHGIPLSELVDGGVPEPQLGPLAVYARPLLRSV